MMKLQRSQCLRSGLGIALAAGASIAAFGLGPGRAIAVTTLVTFPFNNPGDGNSGLNYSAIDASALSAASVGGAAGLGEFTVGSIISPSMQVLKTSPGSTVAGATAADALSNSWYFTISLTPNGSVDLGSITLDWLRSGSSGVRGWFLRSSLDNYATDLYSVITPDGTATALTPVNIALSGFTGLTSQTDFRFYTFTDSLIRRVDFSNLSFQAAGAQPPAAADVPAPLPLLGAGAAFTSARRLRRMIRLHDRGAQR